MRSDPALALSLVVLVAALYLVLLRLVDLNEKEPVWALLAFLFLGASSAGLAALVLSPRFRSETVLGTAATAEACKLLAILAGLGLLAAVRRIKGWSELNGVLDGVVYGAAAGLGFATGTAFVGEIAAASWAAELPDQPGFFSVLATVLVAGLSEGALGAVIGAALVMARDAHGWRRTAFAVGGVALAFGLHVAYIEVLDGGSLYDSRELVGHWLPLAASLALLVGVIARGIAEERRAIRAATTEGAEHGSVAREDLRWLSQSRTRRRAYWVTFKEGRLEAWLELRALHNRHVQRALTQEQLNAARDDDTRRRLQAEVDALTASLEQIAETGGSRDLRDGLRGTRSRVLAVAAVCLGLIAGVALLAAGAVRERRLLEPEAALTAPRSGPAGAGPALLRDQLATRVGRFLLLVVDEDETAERSAAEEAYRLRYETRAGAVVEHRVAAFAEKSQADRWAGELRERLTRDGWSRSDESTRRFAFLTRRGRLAFVFSVGQRAGVVVGRERTVTELGQGLPY
jgi:hypothetical protein